jgi:2-deoxy-D-gluconate 3-dehydrogenase
MGVLDLFRLDGKVALVTGCRRGIGRGFARALAEAGADIIGVSASMESSGSEVQGDVESAGRTFKRYPCEFSDRGSVYKFLDRLQNDGPPIDILVNNAGTIEREPAEAHSDASWDRVIEVNLNTQFVLSREIGRNMLERGGGKIIFTASLLSYQGGITVPGTPRARAESPN